MEKELKELPVLDIEPDPNQPRRRFTRREMEELTESVRIHGVLQPIEVTPIENGRYRIHHGERRWRAATAAGLEVIPAVVAPPLADLVRLVRQTVENTQRTNLNIIEEAKSYQALREAGAPISTIAREFGKPEAHVKSRLIWLEVEEEIQELLAAGQLPRSPHIAEALLKLPAEVRLQITRRVANVPPKPIKVILDLCGKVERELAKQTLVGKQTSSKTAVSSPALAIALKNRQPDPATHISLEQVRFTAKGMCTTCYLKPNGIHEPAWELVSAAAQTVCASCEARIQDGGSLAVCQKCPGAKMLTELVRSLPAQRGIPQPVKGVSA